MPMIDVYATSGTCADPKTLARNLAATLTKIEHPGHPDVPTEHRGIPRPPHVALSNVQGDSNYVRVQVLTSA